jgi:hypothetical protein
MSDIYEVLSNDYKNIHFDQMVDKYPLASPSVIPANDIERVACLLVMLTGCVVVTGLAVASLSLVISLYLRPEEAFRARYRLIMKEMVRFTLFTKEVFIIISISLSF